MYLASPHKATAWFYWFPLLPLREKAGMRGELLLLSTPHPSSPQGERVHFNSDAKCIVRKHFIFCFVLLLTIRLKRLSTADKARWTPIKSLNILFQAFMPLSARAKHVRFDRRLKTFRNYVLGITAQSNSLVLLISLLPLREKAGMRGNYCC